MGLGVFALLDGRVDEARAYLREAVERATRRGRARSVLLAFIDGTLPADETRRVCDELQHGGRRPRLELSRRATSDDATSVVTVTAGSRPVTLNGRAVIPRAGARRAGVDAGPHRLQGALPRHVQRVRLGAAEAGRRSSSC